MYTKARICILILFVSIFLLLNTNYIYAQNNDFYTVCSMLEELESLANEYGNANQLNPQYLVYTYIRSVRYNSFSWMFMAGSPDEGFENFVLSRQTRDLSQLKYQNDLILPNGENLDFIHMIAAMNMTLFGNTEVGSWGGDTVQLASDIRGYSGDIETLKNYANAYLGNTTSRFNYSDIISDIDAINVFNRINENNNSISDTFKNYYLSGMNLNTRTNEYITNYLGLDFCASNNDIYNRLKQAYDEDFWCDSLRYNYEIGDEIYNNHIEASIHSYADYLYNNFYRNYISSDLTVDYTNIININDNSNFYFNYSTNPIKTTDNINIKNLTPDVINLLGNVITPLKTGTAVIRIYSSSNSIVNDYSIEVVDRITNIDISLENDNIYSDESTKINISTYPERNDYKIYTNDDSLTINSDGTITPSKAGSFTIFCESTDGSNIIKKIKLNVEEKTPSIEVKYKTDRDKYKYNQKAVIELIIKNNGQVDINDLKITSEYFKELHVKNLKINEEKTINIKIAFPEDIVDGEKDILINLYSSGFTNNSKVINENLNCKLKIFVPKMIYNIEYIGLHGLNLSTIHKEKLILPENESNIIKYIKNNLIIKNKMYHSQYLNILDNNIKVICIDNNYFNTLSKYINTDIIKIEHTKNIRLYTTKRDCYYAASFYMS